MKFKKFEKLGVRKKVCVYINKIKEICTASQGGIWKVLGLRRAGWTCSSNRRYCTRTSLRFTMKINLVENDRKMEDIKVDVRFDGWEAERTGCAWCPQACLLISSTET